MKTLKRKIQEKLTEDLLSPKYRKLINENSHQVEGHCYVASEVFYHLYGKDRGFKPHVIRLGDFTHWFLKNGDDIIDITKEQFDIPIDYSKGRGCGFLTKQPSKRAKKLMDRLEV